MNYPIKVLFYSEKWTSGGIEAFIMNVYRNLNTNIVQADILTSQNETNIYDEEIKEKGGMKYTTLEKKYNSPIIRTLKNFQKFSQQISDKNYDVIHLHICHGVAMIYAYLAKKAGIKNVIVHSHNTNIGNTNKSIKTIGHIICKYLFERYVDKFLACSDLAAQWLYTKKTINSGKIIIINNAIDSKRFIFNQEEREKFRKDLAIDSKFVIGHIGRFSEQKNHEYLIDIFKEINVIEKEAILLLVGDGELKQSIVDKVERLNLSKNVIFYGLTKDIPKVLWGMDIFILPSLFEGKPVVGIETQAAALKSYISDTITKTVKFSEYIEFLNIKDSPKLWAKEILKHKSKYLRKNMQETIIENGYDISYVAKKMEEIYINILKEK